ncbi:hypothetical protein ACI2KR_08615 [Pseudomonas luteola]
MKQDKSSAILNISKTQSRSISRMGRNKLVSWYKANYDDNGDLIHGDEFDAELRRQMMQYGFCVGSSVVNLKDLKGGSGKVIAISEDPDGRKAIVRCQVDWSQANALGDCTGDHRYFWSNELVLESTVAYLHVSS